MSIPLQHQSTRDDFIRRNQHRLQRISPHPQRISLHPQGQAPAATGQGQTLSAGSRADAAPPGGQGPGRPAAVVMGLLLLLSVMVVSAQTTVVEDDDFNNYTGAAYPPFPEANWPADWVYTVDTGATPTTVDLSTAQNLGGRSLHLASTSSALTTDFSTPRIEFNKEFACEADSVESIEFDMYIDALPTGDESNAFFIAWGADDSSSWQILFPSATSLSMQLRMISSTSVVSSTITLGSMTEDEWYHFTLFNFDCASESFQACKARTLDGTGEVCNTLDVSLAGTMGGITRMTMSRTADPGATDTFGNIYIENYTLTYQPAGQPRYIFCSQPASPNFSYDYVEGVVYNTDATINDEPTTFNDAFTFNGESNDFDYLGKQLNPGSESLAVRFTIRAYADGESSVFIPAFTTDEGGVLLEGANGDAGADMSIAGNGLDTGNFEHNVQLQFREAGDHWAITPYYTDGGAQTQMGSSVNYGQPNTPTTFNLTVDSLTTLFTLETGDGTLIQNWNLPAGLQDNVFDIQWFVGASTLSFDASTDLDDAVDLNDNSDSTCIWDNTGNAAALGDSGSVPGSTVPDVDPDTGGDGTGDGGIGAEILDSPYFWVFVWILLITVSIATLSWATRAGFGGIVYGVAILTVYIGGILFYGAEDVNPWPVVAILVFVVAMAIWSRYR